MGEYVEVFGLRLEARADNSVAVLVQDNVQRWHVVGQLKKGEITTSFWPPSIQKALAADAEVQG